MKFTRYEQYIIHKVFMHTPLNWNWTLEEFNFSRIIHPPAPIIDPTPIRHTETCEKVILYEIENGNWLTKKFFLDFLTIKHLIKARWPWIWTCKKIIICYCCIRLKHHAHLVNEKLKKSGLRTLLSKTMYKLFFWKLCFIVFREKRIS